MAGDIPSPANIKKGPQRRTLNSPRWMSQRRCKIMVCIFSQKMHYQNAFFFKTCQTHGIQWKRYSITPFSVFPIGCSEMDSSNSSPDQKLPLQWTDRTEPGINLKNTKNLTRYPTIFTDSHYKHTNSPFQCNEAEKKKIRTHGKTYEQLGKPWNSIMYH